MVDYYQTEVLGRGQMFNKEYRIRRQHDQAIRWVSGLGKLEIDAQGRPVKMLGTIQDVTDRKLAEEEIRRQAGLISSLLDSIPDIIFFKDVQGVYLGCNPSFAKLVGRAREEPSGFSVAIQQTRRQRGL